MAYETVIGLEIHAQLNTNSKIFCSCSTSFGKPPNTNICPVCSGLPGVLPVLNKKVVELAIKTGLSLNCEIAKRSIFARKNYFYPDLPKAYQVSQYELPIALHGSIEIEVNEDKKTIGITRAHLEEDAGKLVHEGAAGIGGSTASLTDFNRCGVPLLEIVSEPDLRSAEEARVFLTTLAQLLEYLEVCDAKMEEGSLRCDANISLRPLGEKEFGVKTEVKNLNSFRSVYKALISEEKRQRELLEAGKRIIQETRSFDEVTGTTHSLRSKEDAHDYRYFPEPDLVPVEIGADFLAEIKKTIPELPQAKKERFMKEYQLSSYDANLITSSKSMSRFFEESLKSFKNSKMIANWLLGEITAYLKEKNLEIDQTRLSPLNLTEMLKMIEKNTISGKSAKEIVTKLLETGQNVHEVVKEMGATQISGEDELIQIVEKVIQANPKPVADFKKGKENALGFLTGMIMRETKGRANPAIVTKLLRQKLSA